MKTVSALIPKESSKFPFTCYAEGSLISTEDAKTDYRLTFKESDVLILFFYFHDNRRLYITCAKDSIKTLQNKTLQNISCQRQIMAELRGRTFDRFKMTLEIIENLTLKNCYSYPLAFWFQIVMLVQQNKHNIKNIELLCEYYKLLKNFMSKENLRLKKAKELLYE